MWRSAGERLCSLQEMDQGVIHQKLLWPSSGHKITQCQIQIHSKGCATRPSVNRIELPWGTERVSIHNPHFGGRKSSNVTLDFSL